LSLVSLITYKSKVKKRKEFLQVITSLKSREVTSRQFGVIELKKKNNESITSLKIAISFS
jgi:hypothetical protein